MPSPDQENRYDAEAHRQPEVDLGGADDVQKTTYVRGAGAEPDRRSDGPIATVPSRGPPATLIAVLVAIAIVAAVAYLVGLAGR